MTKMNADFAMLFIFLLLNTYLEYCEILFMLESFSYVILFILKKILQRHNCVELYI